MYGFIDELARYSTMPFDEVMKDYKFVMLGGRVFSISGYKKIITYSKEKIVLSIKNGRVIIDGRDLIIKQLDSNYMCVQGIFLHISEERV